MITINLNVKGVGIILTIDELRALKKEIDEVLGARQQTVYRQEPWKNGDQQKRGFDDFKPYEVWCNSEVKNWNSDYKTKDTPIQCQDI